MRSDGERFVAALAKAVHRFRAYPAESPLCAEALETCRRALASFTLEQFTVRVTPRALLVDDEPITETPAVADLRRRLHAMGLGIVTIASAASPRDLGWFCREVVARDGAGNQSDGLIEALAARGVQHVAVATVVRPSVLGAEDVPAERLARVDADERQRQIDGRRAGTQLYPPDKGWVRLDPGLPRPTQISLTGLAQLVGDPLALSAMLVSLADQPPFDDPIDALSDKFATVSALFRSLEPTLGNTLFARLARTVLELPDDRRSRLLQDTVVPALLEGRIDGAMLRHFPDDELVDVLVGAFEDHRGGREWLMVALDRLDLPPERRTSIEVTIRDRFQSYDSDRRSERRTRAHSDRVDTDHITIDLTTPKEFREFAAFDLAIDRDAEATLVAARASIQTAVPTVERLRCLVNLLSLEANPDGANRLLSVAAPLLSEMRASGDQRVLAEWIQRLQSIAATIRGERPEIAALIEGVLGRQIDERLLENLLGLKSPDAAGAGGPLEMLEAFGAAAAPALVDLLEHEGVRSRRFALVKMMSACAPTLAPGLLPFFPHPNKFVTRNLAMVFGHAGPGFEATLAPVVTHPDVRVGREALRALAHIGSAKAREIVTAALAADHEVAAVAEDVFWSFADAGQTALALLADDEFVSRHPAMAQRLLEHASRAPGADLERIAASLTRYRLQFWRPAHMRLGLAAAKVVG